MIIECAHCGKLFDRSRKDVNTANKRGWKLYCGKSCSGSGHRKEKKQCSIDACCDLVLARGFCAKHYTRWQNHGNPTALHKTPPGVRAEWLEQHVNWTSDECLIYPFDRRGYGKATYNGKVIHANRLMCILVYGEPPPPASAYDAAHSCGNGHLRCVNPRHLRWATKKENSADRIIHGTMNWGSRHGSAKLTEEKVRAIRSLLPKKPQHVIAAQFGVTQTVISSIKLGNTWGWLK